jgi:hypothetical protein
VIGINDEYMSLTVDDEVIITARFNRHAAPNGKGAPTHPARLFSRNQAITALTVAERLAAAYGDDDPLVTNRRGELCL